MNSLTSRPLLVVGAGISGISAALEAAETGCEVILVEAFASIGGRVVRNHHYFPKFCPPTCGMEINIGRLERNPRIRLMTDTQVTQATSDEKGWKVTLTSAPMYVNERCTACGECTKVCKATVPDPHNLEMSEAPAIRLAHPDAYPRRYMLDRAACSEEDLKAIVAACQYDAIDLDAAAKEETIEVSSVILATGWDPYPLKNLTDLGGDLKDVISNVNMERMVSEAGPTGGKILKPSTGEPPKKVAFVQCAGSRDVNHLPYCSAVCCLASLKQAIYVHEQLPESEVTIYYIDRRSPGRNEDMLTKVAALDGITLIKGKVGQITQGDGGALKLKLEDVEAGTLLETNADLVVLATGMVPNLKGANLPFEINQDADGFGLDNATAKIFVAGVSRRPEDVAASVRDATGTAAKAFVAAGRSA